ncbi:uncharacterized protein L969DRAFT_195838 [Mixia osmundae IAM 14324]|uniref:uncharacterized protein n=1 Tax=Mixia osmundae (strain CBS 9802 / IAM 14324 / JCM 22182 / KY 12970) TaxID=764103 RepID=UPI0004A5549B|nr:uncharacterized protein L969DRAFT_195838 [Mixia osmundae IAM 14324]KEI37355.1 hypothetical protein L969DRAFT_195838 [Mixia osmundae IAM 14324]
MMLDEEEETLDYGPGLADTDGEEEEDEDDVISLGEHEADDVPAPAIEEDASPSAARETKAAASKAAYVRPTRSSARQAEASTSASTSNDRQDSPTRSTRSSARLRQTSDDSAAVSEATQSVAKSRRQSKTTKEPTPTSVTRPRTRQQSSSDANANQSELEAVQSTGPAEPEIPTRKTKSLSPATSGKPKLDLVPGWIARTSREGKVYYLHKATRKSQWHLPTETDTQRILNELEKPSPETSQAAEVEPKLEAAAVPAVATKASYSGRRKGRDISIAAESEIAPAPAIAGPSSPKATTQEASKSASKTNDWMSERSSSEDLVMIEQAQPQSQIGVSRQQAVDVGKADAMKQETRKTEMDFLQPIERKQPPPKFEPTPEEQAALTGQQPNAPAVQKHSYERPAQRNGRQPTDASRRLSPVQTTDQRSPLFRTDRHVGSRAYLAHSQRSPSMSTVNLPPGEGAPVMAQAPTEAALLAQAGGDRGGVDTDAAVVSPTLSPTVRAARTAREILDDLSNKMRAAAAEEELMHRDATPPPVPMPDNDVDANIPGNPPLENFGRGSPRQAMLEQQVSNPDVAKELGDAQLATAMQEWGAEDATAAAVPSVPSHTSAGLTPPEPSAPAAIVDAWSTPIQLTAPKAVPNQLGHSQIPQTYEKRESASGSERGSYNGRADPGKRHGYDRREAGRESYRRPDSRSSVIRESAPSSVSTAISAAAETRWGPRVNAAVPSGQRSNEYRSFDGRSNSAAGYQQRNPIQGSYHQRGALIDQHSSTAESSSAPHPAGVISTEAEAEWSVPIISAPQSDGRGERANQRDGQSGRDAAPRSYERRGESYSKEEQVASLRSSGTTRAPDSVASRSAAGYVDRTKPSPSGASAASYSSRESRQSREHYGMRNTSDKQDMGRNHAEPAASPAERGAWSASRVPASQVRNLNQAEDAQRRQSYGSARHEQQPRVHREPEAAPPADEAAALEEWSAPVSVPSQRNNSSAVSYNGRQPGYARDIHNTHRNPGDNIRDAYTRNSSRDIAGAGPSMRGPSDTGWGLKSSTPRSDEPAAYSRPSERAADTSKTEDRHSAYDRPRTSRAPSPSLYDRAPSPKSSGQRNDHDVRGSALQAALAERGEPPVKATPSAPTTTSRRTDEWSKTREAQRGSLESFNRAVNGHNQRSSMPERENRPARPDTAPSHVKDDWANFMNSGASRNKQDRRETRQSSPAPSTAPSSNALGGMHPARAAMLGMTTPMPSAAGRYDSPRRSGYAPAMTRQADDTQASARLAERHETQQRYDRGDRASDASQAATPAGIPAWERRKQPNEGSAAWPAPIGSASTRPYGSSMSSNERHQRSPEPDFSNKRNRPVQTMPEDDVKLSQPQSNAVPGIHPSRLALLSTGQRPQISNSTGWERPGWNRKNSEPNPPNDQKNGWGNRNTSDTVQGAANSGRDDAMPPPQGPVRNDHSGWSSPVKPTLQPASQASTSQNEYGWSRRPPTSGDPSTKASFSRRAEPVGLAEQSRPVALAPSPLPSARQPMEQPKRAQSPIAGVSVDQARDQLSELDPKQRDGVGNVRTDTRWGPRAPKIAQDDTTAPETSSSGWSDRLGPAPDRKRRANSPRDAQSDDRSKPIDAENLSNAATLLDRLGPAGAATDQARSKRRRGNNDRVRCTP